RDSGYYRVLDERGPGHAHGDLGYARDLRLWPAGSRGRLRVHLHANRELSVPLLVPHVHDGHGQRGHAASSSASSATATTSSATSTPTSTSPSPPPPTTPLPPPTTPPPPP